MWVWTSMRPGRPVNLERSMIWARGGMSEGLVVTDLILSSSMRTMALVQSLPWASQSLPNLTALRDFGEGRDCAIEVAGGGRRGMVRNVWGNFMVEDTVFCLKWR